MRKLLVMLSLLSLLINPALADEVGKVIAARGETHAVNAGGVQRELKRRSVIFAGDTLFTGMAARLQVRFADGTLLALRPGSEYRIDNYRFDEAEDDENFSTLLKGGFRTITGVISKKNPEAYQVETPVATIGVRGTNYETVLTDKGLDIAAWQGGVKVSTQAGAIEIGAGQDFNFATVAASDTKPQGILKPPPSMTGPLLENDAEKMTPAVSDSSDNGADSLLSAPSSDDEIFLSETEVDSTQTILETSDTTLTTVEPIDSTGDFIQTIAENDLRLDPTEWEKLYNDGYGGLLVFAGENSQGINGGRALAPVSATQGPVFTNTKDIEPYDPAFKTAAVDTVYRQGGAPLDAGGTVPIQGETIYWGVWNGSTTPIDQLDNPNDPNDVTPINHPAFWIVARPEDPMRNDVATYNNVLFFQGGGSLGLLTQTNVTQFTMDINFATGNITNGNLDIFASPDNWVVNFTGTIRGPFVELNLNQSTSLINGSDSIRGDLGGFMTGSGGKALVGGFDLEDITDITNHIEGVFILQE